MPGDPETCRTLAAQFKKLAEDSHGLPPASAFFDLAKTWERLAAELESGEVFIKTMEEIGTAKTAEQSGTADLKVKEELAPEAWELTSRAEASSG
jgi:hypothetical protein